MRWSWRVGVVRGIEVRIHAAFLLLLLWVGGSEWLAGSPQDAVAGIGFALLAFAAVVLHELGHAVVAGRYGIRTSDITLLPIGGVARLERMPENPREELHIALAGPAVNVVLALVLAGLALASGVAIVPPDASDAATTPLLARMVWLNVALATFNMIPAFPMDGGRVLRAMLALRIDRRRATHIAASIGQIVALAFAFVGLFGSPLLVFIALFVWLGASSEASAEDLRASIRDLRVVDVMIPRVEVLHGGDTLATVAAHVISGFQHDFPVVYSGRVQGLLGHADLIRGLATLGLNARVSEVMRPGPTTIEAMSPLLSALEQLERPGCRSLPVVHDGQLVGMVTLESMGELLAVGSALEAGRRSRQDEGAPRAPVSPVLAALVRGIQ